MTRRITDLRRLFAALTMTGLLAATGPGAALGQGAASLEEITDEMSSESTWGFAAGEAATYSVAIGRFRIGEARLAIEGLEPSGDKDVVQTTLTVDGGPPFFRVEMYLSSWAETGSMRSVRFERTMREGPKRYRDRYVLDHESGTYTAERWSEDLEAFEPSTFEPSGAMPADAIDEIAVLYFVRTLPLQTGDEYVLERYFKPHSNPVVVRVLKREEIRVPAGRFQTIVVEPIIPELGAFQAKKEPRVWITDDERRIIVKLQTSVPVGPVALNLTDYEEGSPSPE
ncbi:MAG: DUF3108 domain-containing protein [marine benthic group bacterium]|nr:DUF3108 domain-containing protein [Gemmatimonadota bacterium]